jgi:hypothetical protein
MPLWRASVSLADTRPSGLLASLRFFTAPLTGIFSPMHSGARVCITATSASLNRASSTHFFVILFGAIATRLLSGWIKSYPQRQPTRWDSMRGQACNFPWATVPCKCSARHVIPGCSQLTAMISPLFQSLSDCGGNAYTQGHGVAIIATPVHFP